MARPTVTLALDPDAHALLSAIEGPKGAIGAFVSAAIRAHALSGDLPPDVADYLTYAGPDWLPGVVRQRQAALALAREALASTDWTATEIAAVCEVQAGDGDAFARPAGHLGAEMVDAERIPRERAAALGIPMAGPASERGISPERWAELAARVMRDEPTARALLVVAAEWWADHKGVEEWLGGVHR